MLAGALWVRNVSSNKDESLPSPMWKGADINDPSQGGWLLSLTNVAKLLPAAGWLATYWQFARSAFVRGSPSCRIHSLLYPLIASLLPWPLFYGSFAKQQSGSV